MDVIKHYFFCGIGGSGMLPLAMIVKAAGHEVSGSDRSKDQGRTPEKFTWLEQQGITLFAQDGSGVTGADQILVTSGAVEETIPDVKAAIEAGAARMTRAQLLAELFNAAGTSIGVAGTSGKSTTTGMIGWILSEADGIEEGNPPTVVNGAVMKNFVSNEMPFASAVPGDPNLFVCEVDESDGSITLFDPTIAVLNNVAVDHMGLAELRTLFKAYVLGAARAVCNLDNEGAKMIAGLVPPGNKLTYSLSNPSADFYGKNIHPGPDGISFDMTDMKSGETWPVTLNMPGVHNISNALAAIAATSAVGVPLETAARALGTFKGIRRRLEHVGKKGGITVIDDFAHNPDKITASLRTLHDFKGRLLVFFQPHGFGPLAKMKEEFIEVFREGLGADDVLLMCEPVYFGGTVERKVKAADIVSGVRAGGGQAEAFETRDECGVRIRELKKPHDRIIVMGARDDTLSDFAKALLG